ncbi:unnamed protein product [Meganyctiphanes norvegica]|uniref:Oxidoreductase n=1 Tax=Meganyctiphanes norvegica TaxID=48144 RepID=A0AAV2Q6V2_MEGNR
MSSSKMLRVGFVGAGAVNFGGAEGPWDHASRLEQIPGVEVVGIADMDQDKAHKVLQARRAGQHAGIYSTCKIVSSVGELLSRCKPDAVILGVPPFVRGSLQKGKDLELQVIGAGVHLFCEKPMSVDEPENYAKYVDAINKMVNRTGVVLSVGYMFRYHSAFEKMKAMISAHGGNIMSVNARYYCAYSELDHPFWWDVSKSGGPIVEQATHFADIIRFIAGEVKLESISTICLRDQHPAGVLSKIPKNCEINLEQDNKVPRATVSTFRFENGGVGSLTHTVALQGRRYESAIEVQLDGLRLTLEEPYEPTCRLRIREAGNDDEHVYTFENEDPYMKELETFIQAVKRKDTKQVKSTYADAAKSYLLTWAIRRAERT